MSHARNALFILVMVCGLLVGPPVALAVEGATPVWKAERNVREAKRSLARAEHRLAEAKEILADTRRFTSAYGSSVGRWVRLARRTGWTRDCLPTLFYIINRESRGDPSAANPSGASGLLQLMPCHWQGVGDPFDPRFNLSYGRKLWRGSGWAPWAL